MTPPPPTIGATTLGLALIGMAALVLARYSHAYARSPVRVRASALRAYACALPASVRDGGDGRDSVC